MRKHLLAALTIALLTACAAAPEKTATGTTVPATQATAAAETPEAALRARATAYYATLIAGQYKEAYEFFAPGYRATWSPQAHYQIHPPVGKYLSAEVTDVTCVSETACDVVTATRFRFNEKEQLIGGEEVPIPVTSRWLKVDGTWFFVPRL
ncbi:MAG: hypothetical protein EPO03_06535 [Porticoccaceae bacterium]|nr:MAG: hypothetical protein EPO03_06535 [Porticoccaceae bacterium]